jgi:Na+-transporting NADH:ubiquinone oxidoreductase subunit NqrB
MLQDDFGCEKHEMFNQALLTRLKFFSDARDFQILFLLSFFTIGIWARDFTVRLDCVLAVMLSSVMTQIIADRIWKSPNPSIRSALITAISLCLLLRANHWTTMLFAGSISVLSKFVFRFRGKHFFNPSNFGIVAVLLLMSDGWVTPGQWGEEILFAMFFVGAGLMVVRKVGRWDTTAVFLLSYALLEASRNYWLGWTWDVFAHRLTSGSLLLFAFFMITDPRAIPDHARGRILFATFVAAVAFVLRNYFFLPTAIFWALFVLSPITVLLDRMWSSKRFQWTSQAASPVPLQASVSGR